MVIKELKGSLHRTFDRRTGIGMVVKSYRLIMIPTVPKFYKERSIQTTEVVIEQLMEI